MDISLIGTDGQAINLTSIGSVSFRILESYPAGAFNFPTVEHKVELRTDGRYHLIDTIQRPIVVDLSLHVSGKSMNSWLSELSKLFQRVSFSETPMKLSVTENNKTVYLDVHAEGSSVVPNFLSSEIKLRLVSYGKWYLDSFIEYTFPNNITPASTENLFRLKTPSANQPLFVSMITRGGTYPVDIIAAAPGSDVFFSTSGSTTLNGVTVNRFGKINSNGQITAINGINNGSVYAILPFANNKVYVGGDFSVAGGSVSDRIAFYNGTSLTSLFNGLNGVVLGMCYFRDGAIIYGAFTQTGSGSTRNRIILSSGADLFGGANGTVRVIVPYRNGFVIGGEFSQIFNTSCNKLCFFDGSRATQIPLPMSEADWYPYGLLVHNDELIVNMRQSLYTGSSRLFLWQESGWSEIVFPEYTSAEFSSFGFPHRTASFNILKQNLIFHYAATTKRRKNMFEKFLLSVRIDSATEAFGTHLFAESFTPVNPVVLEVNSPSRCAPIFQATLKSSKLFSLKVLNLTNGKIISTKSQLFPGENVTVNCATGTITDNLGVSAKHLDSIFDPCQTFVLEKGKNLLVRYSDSQTDKILIPAEFDTLEEALGWQ